MLIVAALGVCHLTCSSRCGHSSSERERALEQLPGATSFVAAADGAVLADPTFRRVIEVARSRVPAGFGCVIDAAMAGDAVAVSGDWTGVAVVIVTHGLVAKCPTLSRIHPEVWAATIGAGSLASSPADSALVDRRWSRARDYLIGSPIAFAADLGRRHLIAAATADPVAAWVAIDEPGLGAGAGDLEVRVTGFMERWHALAAWPALHTRRSGDQIVITADPIGAADLSVMVADILAVISAVPARRGAGFAADCPRLDRLILACGMTRNGTLQLTVRSVSELLREISEAPVEVVISNLDVVGLRLTGEAGRVLRRGDVIVAIDARRVVSRSDLVTITKHARNHANLSVRRGGGEAVIELRE